MSKVNIGLSVITGTIFFLSLCLSSAVVKQLHFKNNAQLTLPLSNTDLNKLVIAGDAVTNLSYPLNRMQVKQDSSGAVYLSTRESKPFTAFINTKNHHPLSLRFIPEKKPGMTWLLYPSSPGHRTIRQWEQAVCERADGYPQLLVRIVKAMVNHQVPEDFINVPVTGAPKLQFHQHPLKPVEVWQSDRLLALHYRMTNNSSHPEYLSERQFYWSGVRAIALSLQQVLPKKQVDVYEVASVQQG